MPLLSKSSGVVNPCVTSSTSLLLLLIHPPRYLPTPSSSVVRPSHSPHHTAKKKRRMVRWFVYRTHREWSVVGIAAMNAMVSYKLDLTQSRIVLKFFHYLPPFQGMTPHLLIDSYTMAHSFFLVQGIIGQSVIICFCLIPFR